jgi:hypothetical protein
MCPLQEVAGSTDLLGRIEAARRLGISIRNLDRNRVSIGYVRIGKRVFFTPADLERFIEERRIKSV